ncbi:MAG: response regulator transcription factor [Pleurocapsa sp.]
MNRILIAEDEPRIASFLAKGLRAKGYTITIASNGLEAVSMSLDNNFDLLLLDLGLPKKDGLAVLEELRGQGISIPIIILTARDDLQDKLAGLEGGADDYMTKPFRFEELLARIRLRMNAAQPDTTNSQTILTAENLTLDLLTRQVTFEQQLVELSEREFTLLETFIRHQGQVLSREQLLDHVWGYNYDPGSNIVDVYVGYLRKKLANDLIATVRGVGYRFTNNQAKIKGK